MESFFAANNYDYGVMIVDARHKPTADDITMCDYFKSSGKPFIVIANKADKLKKSEVEPSLAIIEETLGVKPVLFSAEKGLGRDVVIAEIVNLC